MNAVSSHTGVCASIAVDNVDTDQIIPSREMKRVSKHGLGEGLFAGWRYLYDGQERAGVDPEFVLNRSEQAGTSILLGGRNFGCGSSREHAVWALRDFGIKVIIAVSFGRIFLSNCARNGLLAIELPSSSIDLLMAQTRVAPQTNRLTVDLSENGIHMPNGETLEFGINASDRSMLLQGLDYIDYTLQHEAEIDRYVENDRQRRSWAYL